MEENKVVVCIMGGVLAICILMIYALPLIWNSFEAWDRFLKVYFGN